MAPRRSANLPPAGGPPGAAVSFLHGDFAAATMNFGGGGALTFNVYEWRVEYRTTLINTRAHGQRWARKTVIESDWTFTARGYISAGSAAHAPAAGFAGDSADPPTVVVAVYSGSTSGTLLFSATGVMTRGTLDAPDGAMAVQDIEIDGSGAPTTGV